MLEDMSVHDAQTIFGKLGANLNSVKAPADLAPIYKNLVKKHHPDRDGGDLRTMQEINAANDVLKSYYADGAPEIRVRGHDDATMDSTFHPGYWEDVFSEVKKSERPEWCPENLLDYTIRKNDFSDANYFRKAAYEASRKSRVKFSFYASAGFIKRTITVFGTDGILPKLAKAFKFYCDANGDRVSALFYRTSLMPKGHVMLYWLDGKTLEEPISLEYNGNIMSDTDLMNKIRQHRFQ